MKLKALVATCALAFAGQAAALTPTTAPEVQLYISGSSALQMMLGQVATGMFVNGTTAANRTDVFYDGTAAAASGKNYRAYFGLGKSTLASTLAGKKILIIDTALGGSFMGVNPVAAKTALATLLPSSCVMPTTAMTDAATGISVYSCSGTQSIVPDAGVSDLDPKTIAAPINGGSGAVPVGLVNIKPTLAVVMGVPVTSNVPASLTSLSKGQVAGLMGGTIGDWSMIDATATGKSVVVCRRVAGSGTQSVINAQIFGNPCSISPLVPSDRTGTTATLGSSTPVAAGSVVVIENSSSGAVKTCLQNVVTGTMVNAVGKQAIDVTNGSLVALGAANSVVLPAGGYGIGVLGTDQGTTSYYNFASIDGVAPTVANAATGAYDLIGEATFQDRGDLTGAKADLFAEFSTRAGDPAILGTGGTAGAPIAGVAALSESGWVASTPFDPANPVLRVGNFGNMCQPFQTLQ